MKMKTIQRALITGLTVVATGGLFSAQSAVVLSYDAAMPTNNILTEFNPTTGLSSLQWRDNETSERDVGQSFLATYDAEMDSFSMLASGNSTAGASNAAFTVTLYESDVADDIGTSVSTQTGTFFSSGTKIADNWVTFDLDDVSLTAGKYYTFVLSFNNAGVEDQDQVFYQSNEGYATGRRWYSTGGPFTTSTSTDFAFSVQVASIPSYVVVSYNATAPSTNVIASFAPTNVSAVQWRDNESSERDIGQSFLATTDATMDSFALQAGGTLQAGAEGAAFTVDIYESTTSSAIGSVISTQSSVFLTDDSAGSILGTWLTFDITDVDLTAGNYYTFTLSFNNAGVLDQDQQFYYASDNSYTDGNYWRSDNGAGLLSSPTSDLAFIVQGAASGSPPNFPATLAIAVGAGSVTISSEDLSVTAQSNVLQVTSELVSPNWSNIAVSVGITSTNWVISPLTDPSGFYRILTY